MGPSALERRRLCPGSLRMEKGIPETPPSAERGRGTILHECMENYVKGPAVNVPANTEDREAFEHAAAWWDEFKARLPLTGCVIETEVSLDLTPIHPAIGRGTADVLVYHEASGQVWVIDWKFTYVDPPWAPDNIQVAAYLVGAANLHGASRAHGILVCCRTRRESTVTMTAAQLAGAVLSIRQVVGASLSPWAPCTPHPDACRYCRATCTCPAIVDTAHLPILKPPGDITNGELGRICALIDGAMPLIKAYLSRRDRVLAAGGEVPGYVWQVGKGRRVWTEEVTAEVLRKVAEGLGKPAGELTETSTTLVTPAGLEKMWGKSAAVRAALEQYITERAGEPHAVRVE